ncbi:SETMAR [Cordylochernes scorpioides]|uniref:SETMAR n=1 Tax=Cordylochernes scorpioides TaxID=51811 RepID=A0ABY6K079_9ARAC|nr:SETMAR [Cordylochernes scorpioides]
MAISEPKSANLREVLLFAFNWKKSAIEAHRMLEEVYGDHDLSKSQCYRWFKKFQSGDFEPYIEPRGKPHQKLEDAELRALLDEDSTQAQEKLAKQLQVSQGAVSLRLNSLGMTQKLSRWVPHELSERQQERCLVTCEGLLARHEKNSFLHRIVTSDEKWIHFSNPMRQKSWGLPGQFPKQTPRPNRFGKKAMLCLWWDQPGVVYFELLKPGEMVNTSRYEQQMHSLREALNEKRPKWREKHKGGPSFCCSPSTGSATEAHRMLEEVYSDHALSKSQCYRWFKKFQSGDFELDNEPHGKPPQKFEDPKKQALLDEDSTQTQEKLAK